MRTVGSGLAIVLAALAVGCGNGKDRSFSLPAGTRFDSERGDRVLVVVEANNDCRAYADCAGAAADTPGGCDVGQGNRRGLAVYRLGASGLLFHDGAGGPPGQPERVIPTATNPRRVLAHPDDPRLLYVATAERIQVFRLASDGSAACVAQTRSEREVDPRVEEILDPVDLTIDPTVGNGVLYVAASGASRVDAYAIAPDGSIPEVPTSCVVGPTLARFTALALATDRFLGAGGRISIDVYARQDGQFPPPTPDPSATPTPLPSPAPPACTGARLVTVPLSTIRAAFVTNLAFTPSLTRPLGELLVAEEVSRRILAFPIDADGMLDDRDTSRTSRAGVYQRILRHRLTDQDLLYASVFNEGRVDVFRTENGALPRGAFSRTTADPDALPVGLAIDGEVLYVAQGGLGRVDGFAILPDGGLEPLPVTSTEPAVGANGLPRDTFPNDVAVVPLP